MVLVIDHENTSTKFFVAVGLLGRHYNLEHDGDWAVVWHINRVPRDLSQTRMNLSRLS